RAIDPVKDKDGNITGWTFTGVDANLVGGYFAGNGDFGSLVSQLEGYRGNFGSGPLSSFWSTFNSNRLNMKFVSTSSAGRNYFGANGVSHLATTVIDVSVMPFDDWVKSLGGNTESGFDWDKLNGNMGAFGLGNGIKTELIDYTIRSNYKSARSWWEFNKLESTEKAWRTTNTLGKTGANYLKFSKGLGTVVAAGTTAYSWYNTYDYYNNGGSDGKVLAKTVIDTIMTGVGFLGPIGFGISATYFILDYATDGFGGFGSIE
ncbi:MAG: hypothetical protein WCY63_10825, partial [Weeksellaceae bacterium]